MESVAGLPWNGWQLCYGISGRLRAEYAIIVVAVLAGCASYQNLTAAGIRTEKYFYKSFTVGMRLLEVKAALYKNSNTCRPMADVTIDPANPTKGQFVVYMPGLTNLSVVMVMDFQEDSKLGVTKIDGYTYYSTWHGKVDEVVSAIESPEKC